MRPIKNANMTQKYFSLGAALIKKRSAQNITIVCAEGNEKSQVR